jgi:hypothetical protein
MKSEGILRPVLVALGLALIIYVGGFSLDQHFRTRRGPWRVTYATEPSGTPFIKVDEPALGISNLKIVFNGESATNASGVVAFDIPEKPVPFGSVKFEDLTYLPGTVTLDLFGHEIELIPRTLFINREERPWQSNVVITLSPSDKRSLPPRPKK